MQSPGINGGELSGQSTNPGSPGKWSLKQSVCVAVLFKLTVTITVTEK